MEGLMDIETAKKMMGLAFKFLREERGLSRAALAKEAGVSVVCLRHFEQGVRDTKLVTLFALMDGLKIPRETTIALLGAAMENPEKWLAEHGKKKEG